MTDFTKAFKLGQKRAKELKKSKHKFVFYSHSTVCYMCSKITEGFFDATLWGSTIRFCPECFDAI